MVSAKHFSFVPHFHLIPSQSKHSRLETMLVIYTSVNALADSAGLTPGFFGVKGASTILLVFDCQRLNPLNMLEVKNIQ